MIYIYTYNIFDIYIYDLDLYIYDLSISILSLCILDWCVRTQAWDKFTNICLRYLYIYRLPACPIKPSVGKVSSTSIHFQHANQVFFAAGMMTSMYPTLICMENL